MFDRPLTRWSLLALGLGLLTPGPARAQSSRPILSPASIATIRREARDPSLPAWQRNFMGALAAAPAPRAEVGPDGDWLSLVTPTARSGASGVWDSRRNRMLIFGGTDGAIYLRDVWQLTLDGAPTPWSSMEISGPGPVGRAQAAVIYDSDRDRLVVYGGRDAANSYGDCWELSLDGVPRWREITPPDNRAGTRYGSSALYDSLRHRMVVFGGARLLTPTVREPRNDVWALDLAGATVWSPRTAAGPAPAVRSDAACAYDAGHDRMVVYGGYTADLHTYRDTWTFDLSAGGAGWDSLRSGSPGFKAGSALLFDADRNRILLFGGALFGGSFDNALYTLSLGTSPTWTQLHPGGTIPRGRASCAAAFDPANGRWILFGGRSTGQPWGETFALAIGTTTWSAIAAVTLPTGLEDHVAAFDPVRNRMIVFGGWNATARNTLWSLSLDGTPTWSVLPAAGTAPGAWSGQSAIYDPVRDRLLIFGGWNGTSTSYRNDVWALNLSPSPAWQLLNPAAPGGSPLPRTQHSAVYDPVRDRMIVYGGHGFGTVYGDLWGLSLARSGSWAQITTGTSHVPARYSHTAIYDPVGDRMIVFGGKSSSGLRNDVQALALTGSPLWQALSPAGVPPTPRSDQAGIYDPVRKRLVLFGGKDAVHVERRDDVWALTLGGAPAWTELTPDGQRPRQRQNLSAVYDPLADRMLLFGGADGIELNDTAELLWGAPAGEPAVSVHPDRGGDNGEVTVEIDGLPFVDGTRARLRAAGGAEISAAAVRSLAGGGAMAAAFDLRGVAHGIYDLEILRANQDIVTLPASFTVEPGRPSQLWVHVVGRTAMRVGRPATYTIEYGNDGNVDATGVPLLIHGIPADASWTLSPAPVLPLPIPGVPDHDWSTLPIHTVVDGEVFLPLIVSRIPAGGSGHALVMVSWSHRAGEGFELTAGISELHYTRRFGLGDAIPLGTGMRVAPNRVAVSAEECAGLDKKFILRVIEGVMPYYSFSGECLEAIASGSAEYFGVGMQEVLEKCHGDNLAGCLIAVQTQQADGVFAGIALARDCSPAEMGVLAETRWLPGYNLAYQGAMAAYDAYQIIRCNLAGYSTVSRLPVWLVGSHDPNDKVGPTGIGPRHFISGGSAIPYEISFENASTATAPAAEVTVTDALDLARLDPASFELGPITVADRTVAPPAHVQKWSALVDLRPRLDVWVRASASFDATSGIARWSFLCLDPATGMPSEDPLAGFLPPNVVSPEGEGHVGYSVRPRSGLQDGTEIHNIASIVFDTNDAIVTPDWSNTLDTRRPVSHVASLTPVARDSSFVVSWSGNDEGSGVLGYSVYVSRDGGPWLRWKAFTAALSDTFYAANGHTYAFHSVARDSAGNVEPGKSAPEASTAVTAALLSLVSADAEPGVVRLRWIASAGRIQGVTLERQIGSSGWASLGELEVSTAGELSYEDHDLTPGARVGYRLRAQQAGVEQTFGEAWVEVPSNFSLRLAGLRPNPAIGDVVVTFALATSHPADVSLFDVAGRRVATERMGAPAPGNHSLRIARAGEIAPGIYVIRLTQDGRTVTARGVVVR